MGNGLSTGAIGGIVGGIIGFLFLLILVAGFLYLRHKLNLLERHIHGHLDSDEMVQTRNSDHPSLQQLKSHES